MLTTLIVNEKELGDARIRVAKLSEALTSSSVFSQVVDGLPPEIVSQVMSMMSREREALEELIEAYEIAKESGNTEQLERKAGNDPGLTLIVARIAKGFSQKELAWRLGIKEEQVQRYEKNRYSCISIKDYKRIALLLGVKIEASITKDPALRGLDQVIADVSKSDIKKILSHGRNNAWFTGDVGEAEMQQMIAENRIQFGSPSLLRTGLNVIDHSADVLLHAWWARVSLRARMETHKLKSEFDPLNIGWLKELVRLSVFDNGPVRARNLLFDRGLILIVEPQIPGLAVDGAAFLDNNVPVIGMTNRRDAVDNFWFTLLHELGHAILHFRSGLALGYFDQENAPSLDEQEVEADNFARSMLIPEERWRHAPARISNSNQTIENFAKEIGVHPAIVYGRIRKERNNYTIFSDKIAGKSVRKQFEPLNSGEI